MRKQSVELQPCVGEPLAAILGDPRVLRQALRNVIANALEAMPKGGSLEIAAHLSDDGGRVDLSVADSGHGIAQDRMNQIFKPFVTSKRGGLGVGLTLVKRIVERHGGRVALSSEEGRGTTVTLQLPVEAG